MLDEILTILRELDQLGQLGFDKVEFDLVKDGSRFGASREHRASDVRPRIICSASSVAESDTIRALTRLSESVSRRCEDGGVLMHE